MLTKGKGNDIEDGDEEGEEKSKEEESVKKKGKVTITMSAKTSTIVFSRRSSRKKFDKEGGDVIFKKPPPTFEERLKAMESGVGMVNFKIPKYETRDIEEQKQIEDMIISKMGKLKYSLYQLS